MSATRPAPPLVMDDVMRELQLIADLAARREASGVVEASRRAQSLLARLRNQFVFEVVGPATPSSVVAVASDAA